LSDLGSVVLSGKTTVMSIAILLIFELHEMHL